MQFLGALVCVALLACVFRQAIKRHPSLLYVLAALFDVAIFAFDLGMLPKSFGLFLVTTMRRGGLGVAFFVVVMFIGVLPRDGRLSRWLRPIRAELSIAGCILIAGHIAAYLPNYFSSVVVGGVVRRHMLVAVVLGLCLLILLLVLGATSLRVVKRRMKASSWKKLQNSAYAFYALIYFHLMFMLGPSALSGGQPALTNAIVYSAVFGAYGVLRIVRAVADRKNQVDLAKTIQDQGFAS